MNQYNFDKCSECPFMKARDGVFTVCEVFGNVVDRDTTCIAFTPQSCKMTTNGAIKVLHTYQKWSRGGEGKMPPPRVIGIALDVAIRELRAMKNNSK